MVEVVRSAWVMHSAGEMYALVNDIDSYAEFLPWCGASEVLTRGEGEMVAEVQVAYRGLRKSFTTRNRLRANERITMSLVEGPFSELYGVWEFKALREDACKISLDLSFDFSNAAVGALVGPVFKQIADSLVDSFVQRAAELYPRGGEGGAASVSVG